MCSIANFSTEVLETIFDNCKYEDVVRCYKIGSSILCWKIERTFVSKKGKFVDYIGIAKKVTYKGFFSFGKYSSPGTFSPGITVVPRTAKCVSVNLDSNGTILRQISTETGILTLKYNEDVDRGAEFPKSIISLKVRNIDGFWRGNFPTSLVSLECRNVHRGWEGTFPASLTKLSTWKIPGHTDLRYLENLYHLECSTPVVAGGKLKTLVVECSVEEWVHVNPFFPFSSLDALGFEDFVYNRFRKHPEFSFGEPRCEKGGMMIDSDYCTKDDHMRTEVAKMLPNVEGKLHLDYYEDTPSFQPLSLATKAKIIVSRSVKPSTYCMRDHKSLERFETSGTVLTISTSLRTLKCGSVGEGFNPLSLEHIQCIREGGQWETDFIRKFTKSCVHTEIKDLSAINKSYWRERRGFSYDRDSESLDSNQIGEFLTEKDIKVARLSTRSVEQAMSFSTLGCLHLSIPKGTRVGGINLSHMPLLEVFVGNCDVVQIPRNVRYMSCKRIYFQIESYYGSHEDGFVPRFAEIHKTPTLCGKVDKIQLAHLASNTTFDIRIDVVEWESVAEEVNPKLRKMIRLYEGTIVRLNGTFSGRSGSRMG